MTASDTQPRLIEFEEFRWPARCSTGPAAASRLAAGCAPAAAIRAVWPDREHALIGVVGAAMNPDSLAELRERVDALLIGGVRYLLVDLSEAQPCGGAVRAALAEAAARLRTRHGWLRIHPSLVEPAPPSPVVGDATLLELFAIYRAVGGDTGGRSGR